MTESSLSPMEHRQRGTSLIEVCITGAILLLAAGVVARSIQGLDSSREIQVNTAKVSEVLDGFGHGVESKARQAARIFSADDYGMGLLERLDLPQGAIATGSRLPLLAQHGTFLRDDYRTPETGNILLMACEGMRLGVRLPGIVDGLEDSLDQLNPSHQTASQSNPSNGNGKSNDASSGGMTPGLSDGRTESAPFTSGNSGEMRLMASFNFSAYYVSRASDGELDLGRWASVTLADYRDLEQIQDTQERSDLLAELHRMGVRFAWHPDLQLSHALYSIQDGWLEPLASSEKLPGNGDLCDAAMFQRQGLAIATNGSLPGEAIPKYARPDPTTGFPAGFEVKLDGPANGRLLMVRLVLAPAETEPSDASRLRTGSRAGAGALERVIHCRRTR